MSRSHLFAISVILAAWSVLCLILAISLQHKDIRSYIASHYQAYSHDAGGTRYLCTGSPAQVADTLNNYQNPAARASSGGTQYLRYDDAIVSVGVDGTHPCSIRVEDLSAGYSHGSFIYLGPGFYPGSPSRGSGGSTGGPGGTK
ncbi:DUF4247 domain-containing protein [Candidatus Mycobacterium wuenschmannii]|uniref:DUF4247 domain-containing protein n=1 Tax=Candidatus Mycobacterium wuenschmannii TaxID=3027808 RepID=A0ABY8VZJ2_9MYCO|nr:DUF4247 domain-containing protein [Candidatus Mycobacterium wuenschmannii]WIM88511.1 DUF4247 domain-containing protein [Candidatus Mycobacterium wuenschmannii]